MASEEGLYPCLYPRTSPSVFRVIVREELMDMWVGGHHPSYFVMLGGFAVRTIDRAGTSSVPAVIVDLTGLLFFYW